MSTEHGTSWASLYHECRARGFRLRLAIDEVPRIDRRRLAGPSSLGLAKIVARNGDEIAAVPVAEIGTLDGCADILRRDLRSYMQDGAA